MDTLTEKRKELVRALRSGEFDQVPGALVTMERYQEEVTTGYCCIGVGLHRVSYPNVIDFDTPEDVGRDSFDDSSGYERFRGEYDVSEELSEHLISMNDGDFREGNNGSSGRAYGHRRSFAFIARYLEIVWELGDNRA